MKSMLTIQIYGQAKIFAVKITYTSSIGSTIWLLLCIDKILICNNILVAVYTIIQTNVIEVIGLNSKDWDVWNRLTDSLLF